MNLKVYTLIFLLFSTLFLPSCASKKNNETETQASQATEQTPTRTISIEEEFQLLLENYNYEIEKMQSKIKLLTSEINEIKAYKELWSEPLSVYNKKIIMINGTSIYGNVVFQDEKHIKVETFIGSINIPKTDVIRIVDNHSNIENKNIAEVDIIKNSGDIEYNENNNYPNSAKIILLGDFTEARDESFNTILSGTVKNIGKKRADFVKINFTIYKDKQTEEASKEYTVFIKGETQEFENNIISHSSLSENSIGEFSIVIPSDFGPFTSYTFNFDWEQYN